MKVLLGLSGGVDSSYAALCLLRQGYEVEAAVLRMHEHTEISAAISAAESIGIPLRIIDATESFAEVVKNNFISEYSLGRTPNPCIICNERVKFAALHSYARKNGFDKISTGHYAGVGAAMDNGEMRYAVFMGLDRKKDQSYMLYRLPQDILRDLLLPLAEIEKKRVRADSKEERIPTADRPDSQEICFLPDGDYASFVSEAAGGFAEGDFIDSEGRVIGRHRGIVHYTVGQRKGLGISLGERMFVTEIDAENNTVRLEPTVSGKTRIALSDMVYSGFCEPKSERRERLDVKLRYSATPIPAQSILYPDRTAILEFDEPVKAAPGQSAVMYCEGRVMCGGFIK